MLPESINTPMGVSETRNSRLRALVSPPIEKAVIGFQAQHPRITEKVTADYITLTGLALTALGTYFLTRGHKTIRTIGTGVLLLGNLSDGIDGPWSRARAAKLGIPESTHGNPLDSTIDGISETVQGIGRICNARSTFGRIAALGTVLTNSLPRLARSLAESRGVKVAETGGQGIRRFGTRLGGRWATGIAGLVFPQAQPVLDTLTVAANTTVAAERLHQGLTRPPTLSEQTRADARIRLPILLVGGVVPAVAVGLLTAKKITKK